MIDCSKGLSCIFGCSCFGETFDFDEEKFFVFGDFLNEVGNTRKSLGVILSFQGFIVPVEVGNVVFNLLDLIGGCLGLFD